MFVSFKSLNKRMLEKMLCFSQNRRSDVLTEARSCLEAVQEKTKTRCKAVAVHRATLVVECPTSSDANELRFANNETISRINQSVARRAIAHITYIISQDSEK